MATTKTVYHGLTAEDVQQIIELSFAGWGEIEKPGCKYLKVLGFEGKRPKLQIEVPFIDKKIGTLPLSFFITINADGFIAAENWGNAKFAISNPIEVYKILAEKFKPSKQT